jgi:hypothetical protein
VCVCVCVCVCVTKDMAAGSTRYLFMKQNTLLPSVVINFETIIQPQSCYVTEYLEIIILISVLVFE